MTIDPSIPTEEVAEELRRRRAAALEKMEQARHELEAASLEKRAGRPKSPRCRCGAFTASQAAKKGHTC